MTAKTGADRLGAKLSWVAAATVAATFLALYGPVLLDLVRDWATREEYRHGFLLLPVAIYLARGSWRAEIAEPDRVGGAVVLTAAVALSVAATVAAELFTLRIAALAAIVGLCLFYLGREQLRAWWLPFGLLVFTIPLPEVVLNSLTLPLQILASELAVGMLEFRRVPVMLTGNVIQLPGHELFVAEACSGLRSLSALLGVTLLFAGTGLALVRSRVLLLALAVPAAIAGNAVRVFATGYLVYYFGPRAAEGTVHAATGLLVFVFALGAIGLVLLALRAWEARRSGGDA